MGAERLKRHERRKRNEGRGRGGAVTEVEKAGRGSDRGGEGALKEDETTDCARAKAKARERKLAID